GTSVTSGRARTCGSEGEGQSQERQERALRERPERVAPPGLEGVEEGVPPVERVQDSQIGPDRGAPPTPLRLEYRVQLEIDAQEVLVEPFRERRALRLRPPRAGGAGRHGGRARRPLRDRGLAEI